MRYVVILCRHYFMKFKENVLYHDIEISISWYKNGRHGGTVVSAVASQMFLCRVCSLDVLPVYSGTLVSSHSPKTRKLGVG